MIDVRQAVAAATNYIGEFSDLLPIGQLRLEETEYNERDGVWYITLSFIENAVIGTRAYKLFGVEGQTGQVKFMRARNVLVSAVGTTGPTGPVGPR
jgi:hypothetical protein